MKGGGRRIELDEDGEEITSVHSDDLESRPTLPPMLRAGAPPTESTVALPSSRIQPPGQPPRDEQTVLLAADGLPPEGPDDGGWATVVLPGGGYPAHVADSTQLLAVDEVGAPEPVEPVITENLPGMGAPRLDPPPRSITVPSLPPSRPSSLGVAVHRIGGASPSPAVRAVGGSPPPVGTGGHPTVGTPPTGGYATVGPPPTGGYPTVGGASSGTSPVVPSRGRPAAPARPRVGAPVTGALPTVARPDESTRLAWGFFVGVLIAIAIVGSAVVLVMLVMP